MPQAIPAIVASLQAIGFTTVTAASVKAFLLKTVATMALSAAASALMPKPDMAAVGGGITTNVTTAGSSNPRAFVLGRYTTAGFAITPPYTWDINDNDNAYLTYVIDLSDAPITGIDTYYIDGKPYNVVPDASEVGDKLDGELNGHAWVRFHDGNQTQADTLLTNVFHNYDGRPINNTFIMKGVAYSVLTFKYDNDKPKYAGQPSVKFQVRGMKLYDPRKDSTQPGGSGSHRWGQPNTYEFTTNPIIMIYNILRGITLAPGHVYGLNVKANALPNNFWFAAANVCDQAGNDPTSANWYGDKKRYQAGMEVEVDQEPLTVIEELLKSCSGMISEYGGQYIVTAGSPEIPVAHITDETILADQPLDFTVSQGLSNRYNGIIAGFPDPRKLWEENDAVPLFNPAFEEQDGGRRLVSSVKYPTVPYPVQVRRLMREAVSDYRRQRQHSIVLPPSYLNLKPTQCITWTSPKNGYETKTFMIIAKTVDPVTLHVGIALKERNPADYDYDAVNDNRVPTVPATTENLNIRVGVPNFTAVPYIIGSAGNAQKAAIKMTWKTGLSYRRIKYQIRLTQTQAIVKCGTISDSSDGVEIVSDGILSNTSYQVREMAGSRNAQWGVWKDVLSGQDKTDMDAIDQALLDDVQEFKDWMNDGFANSVVEQIDLLRQEINDDVSGIQADVITNVRNQLVSNTNWLATEISSAIGISNGYTDTKILAEQVARNAQNDAMVGRIEQLTAAITSEQLLVNGDFSISTGNDFDSWEEIGTLNKINKNTASTDTLIANMPSDYAVNMNSGGTNSLKQTFDLGQYTAQDKLQFKFRAGALGTASRSIEVTIRWFNATGTVLTPQYQVPHPIAANSVWRMVADRADIPVNSRTAEITIRHASTSGQRILLAKAEASMINAAIEATVSELQAAQVTMNTAIVTLTSNVNARFNAMSGSITDNVAVLTNNINSVASRVGVVEARSANNATKISSLETAVANATSSIGIVENRLSARIGLTQKVKDGSFVSALADWNGTITPAPQFGAKDVASTVWPVSQSPAGSFIILRSGMTGSITTERFPVAGGEVYDVSFDYARASNGVIPRLHYRFRRVDGTFTSPVNIQNGSNIYGEGSGKWITARHNGIIVPDDAVTGEVLILARDATPVNNCWITNVSFKRREAFEAQVAADIEDIRVVSANTIASIASVKQELTANFNGLANTVSTHATALNNVYTKAQTNAAIAAQISAYGVTVNNLLGQRAYANTVSALTTRVSNAEGNLSSQSQSLTTLDNRITSVDNGKGRVIHSSTEPTGSLRDTKNVWFDLTNGANTPHRWNGSAWVEITDKAAINAAVAKANTEARAFATNLVTTEVNALKNGVLTSQANSLNAIKADVGRVYAGGKIRMTALATPTGSQGMVGIHAEAGESGASHVAGIQLVAESNGRTSVRVVAQDFAVVDDSATNPTEIIPFRVMDGQVRMHGAFIGNLTVGTLSVKDNAISTWETAFTSASIEGENLNFEIQRLTMNKGRSDPLLLCYRASYSGVRATITLQRKIGSGDWTTVDTSSVRSGGLEWYVDTWSGTGNVSYRLLGTRYYEVTSNSSGGQETRTLSAAGPFYQRFIGALNMLK